MDPTVPRGAAILLDFVRDTEVGTESRAGYDVIYGFNQDKLDRPVTTMTIDEVQAQQASWSKRFGSSATAGYQFMRATLGDLKRELGLSGTQVLDPNLQDRLAYHLLKRRGYEQYVAGLINRTEFGKRLAMEWASFPVLAATKGAHRSLSRGQSYYAGDRLNKALVKPEEVEVILDDVLIAARVPEVAPIPTPRPEQEAPMPAPIGHNGGPAIEPTPASRPSPVEQASKAKGAAKGAAKGTSFAGALIVVMLALDLLPASLNSAEVGAALATIVTGISSTLWATIDAYMAPKNAE